MEINQKNLPPDPQDTYKLPHRLIEKKRRDRINECIAQLKDLLPEHLKLTVSNMGVDGFTSLCCSVKRHLLVDHE